MFVDETEQDLLASLGISALKPEQCAIIDAMCNGEDVLAILPTGFGKSLCFQLPGLLSDGVTIVISPLLSLMRDQVDALVARGFGAAVISSAETDEEIFTAFHAAAAGTCKLLYMSPEYFTKHYIFRTLQDLKIVRVVIDEVHTVSEWGHDFREDFLLVRKQVERLGHVPIAGFTATASAIVIDDLRDTLFAGRMPRKFQHSVLRNNIRRKFVAKENPRQQLLDCLDAMRGFRTIVYVGTRKRAESIAQALSEAKHLTTAYHAGFDSALRQEIERDFKQGRYDVVVATNAFGMGVDIPDIRLVLHADFPPSPENYLQEIGRAGRDGEISQAICFIGADDIDMRQTQIAQTRGSEVQKELRQVRLQALLDIAQSPCIDQAIGTYFGEDLPQCGQCGSCEYGPVNIRNDGVARTRFEGHSAAKSRYEALLSLRNRLVHERGRGVFRALPDEILIRIAGAFPRTVDELAAIDGIGEKRLKTFGDDILALFTDETSTKSLRKEIALAGRGADFDELSAAFTLLYRGETGLETPLSMPAKLVSRLVAAAPKTESALRQIRGMDDARVKRYAHIILERMRDK